MYSFYLSKYGANITHILTWPPTLKSEIQLCYAMQS